MGTAEIKAELAARYPGIKFARRSKAKEDYGEDDNCIRFGYTNRVFQATNKIVVVTTDREDDEIISVTEVDTVPDKDDLKASSRPWNKSGPLSDYYFAINSEYLLVTPKELWDAENCISDSSAHDLRVESFLGVTRATDSTYELDTVSVSTPRHNSPLEMVICHVVSLYSRIHYAKDQLDEVDRIMSLPLCDRYRFILGHFGAIEKPEIGEEYLR